MSPVAVLKDQKARACLTSGQNPAKIPLGQYFFQRLVSCGARSVFGVPGDFNLSLLEHMYAPEVVDQGLNWIGTCNELNAAYAADGYSRYSNTIGCVVTTFGVGELSALNGIAGAFAENVKVLHVVGVTPSLFHQNPTHASQNVHHLVPAMSCSNFEPPNHRVYYDMVNARVSCSSAFLDNIDTACDQIDNVITEIYRRSQPGYIFIPADFPDMLVSCENLNNRPLISLQEVISNIPTDDADTTRCTDLILEQLYKSKKPAVIADMLCDRYGLNSSLRNFVEKAQLWNFSSAMGRSILNEASPNFKGCYNGLESNEQAISDIQQCDLILHWGAVKNEMNTGHYSYQFGSNTQLVELHPNYIRFVNGKQSGKHLMFNGTYFGEILDRVSAGLDITKLNFEYPETQSPSMERYNPDPRSPITQLYLQQTFPDIMKPGDVLIVETGSFQFGVRDYVFPSNLKYISQSFYLSIGMALPCALGVGIGMQDYPLDHIYTEQVGNLEACPPRLILCEGDGAAQMTIQELTSFLRYKVPLELFVWNNKGYTVERAIKGPTRPYNDIMMWKWTKLLEVLGDFEEKQTFSRRFETIENLSEFFELFQSPHNKLIRLVEVVLDVMDFPEQLKVMAAACQH
ncbi:LANO_0H21814g1_1 [Lachancea nothofagi CBS 11611]|uniref:LANO_0H21814g1_1 n=1 Tax=Lachancea nothofagi CBS 11611 TaxID=1266666 RepID=A0A1G4KNT9_9SACH|nr:LANO_0H21814g1_1 [Lachancea nothofagi CBS 11611]